MNRVDEYLSQKRSRMILTIHDEFLCEIHESEIQEVPKMILGHMETSFPRKFIPLTASMEWSPTSMGEKRKGFPI